MTITNKKLIEFVVLAKKNTYASVARFNEAKQGATRLNSKDLAFQDGDFKYWDTYVGNSGFSGSEVVWYQEIPVWSMNYIGRMLTGVFGGEISEFLMHALAKVNLEMPYRGPVFYQDGKFTYVNSVTGDFDWFSGKELIYYEGIPIYELVYHGGEVKK